MCSWIMDHRRISHQQHVDLTTTAKWVSQLTEMWTFISTSINGSQEDFAPTTCGLDHNSEVGISTHRDVDIHIDIYKYIYIFDQEFAEQSTQKGGPCPR